MTSSSDRIRRYRLAAAVAAGLAAGACFDVRSVDIDGGASGGDVATGGGSGGRGATGTGGGANPIGSGGVGPTGSGGSPPPGTGGSTSPTGSGGNVSPTGSGGSTSPAGSGGMLGSGGASGTGGRSGSGGQPGSGGAAVTPVLQVNYRAVSTIDIGVGVIITHMGGPAIPVSQIRIRYYFTAAMTASPIINNWYCKIAYPADCAPFPLITFPELSPPRPGADHYMEIVYSGNQTLAPFQTYEVQLTTSGISGAATDDYSFFDTLGGYGVNDKVTVYVGGALVYGTPPP